MEVNTNFYYLVRFLAEFSRVPKARETYEGKNVGWYFHRLKKSPNKLPTEDREFLSRLGIDLTTKNPQELVHEKLNVLVEFLANEKRLPKYNDIYKGIRLNVFFRNILSGNTKLSLADQIALDQAVKETSQ